ncbi:hypothetical protein MC45_07015 [Sphingomonas taxi]|uniref:DUF418 domain-containing protein n=1 Tax=Sphingomonas taxi TaxID=1549858 RepID=A0A097EF29_9SPHN|nr:DUF418 domain-containing protein [Sphingomonas taxi]AIT06183.1 hypothetical protein MC45_07015 [Sphingomonas taxi]
MTPADDEPDGAPRLVLLDILRGVAILAILLMNVSEMGASMTANWSDIRHIGWSGADRVAWWLDTLLVEGTARALLEMLFGAGMLILTERIAAASDNPLAVALRYGWRNAVLWALGIAHMFLLLWPGDILHTYAVAALIACAFRTLSTRALFVLGLSYAAFTLASGLTTEMPASARVQMARENAAAVAREDRFGHGSPADWTAGQRRVGLERLGGEEIVYVWEAVATMLIGAGLFRLGALQGGWSRRRYWRMLAWGYGIGLPLRVYGAWEATRFDGRIGVAWMWDDIARLAMTLGHVAAVALLVGSARGGRWLAPFAAAGRTALTLYVAQTLIVSWLIFSPYGLGLYGRMGWAAMMALALAVDALLLWAAVLWVRRFRIAPVEWAWRSVVEGRWLPLR